MSTADWCKLLLCGVTIGPAILLCLQWSGVIYRLTELEQGAVGIAAESLAIGVAVAWMLVADRLES